MFDKIVRKEQFCAIKLECSDSDGLCRIHSGASLDDSKLDWLWPAIRDAGLTLTLDLGSIGSCSYQTHNVRAIAEHYPDLRVVIAHLAQPRPAIDIDSSSSVAWNEQIDLGYMPNVWFDIFALPMYVAPEPYPFSMVRRYIKSVIERLGPEKVLFGTNTPGMLIHATYPQFLAATRDHISFLSRSDQEMV